MDSFVGVDYFNIESLLSEEEILVRNTVRDFVSQEIIPIIEKCNRESRFPLELLPRMASLGILVQHCLRSMAEQK